MYIFILGFLSYLAVTMIFVNWFGVNLLNPILWRENYLTKWAPFSSKSCLSFKNLDSDLTFYVITNKINICIGIKLLQNYPLICTCVLGFTYVESLEEYFSFEVYLFELEREWEKEQSRELQGEGDGDSPLSRELDAGEVPALQVCDLSWLSHSGAPPEEYFKGKYSRVETQTLPSIVAPVAFCLDNL